MNETGLIVIGEAMVRNYKRTTPPVDQEKLFKAVKDVKEGSSIYKAAKKYGLAETTIRRAARIVIKKEKHRGCPVSTTSHTNEAGLGYSIDSGAIQMKTLAGKCREYG